MAVVEKHLIGGECSFYGCMPSKALLRPAEAIAEARRIPGAAEAVTGELDVAAVLARRDEVIHDRDDSGMLPWLEKRGATVVRGNARVVGERRVDVDGRQLEARARGRDRDRQRGGDPADPRASPRRRVDEPRGDDLRGRARSG